MKNILCYGDSNTWGYIPVTGGRYPLSVRWTGVAAQALGPDYRVLEEGLSGRTTVFDSPFNPELNGKSHLACALMTHAPLDLAVLMLGTNDLQHRHCAYDAAAGSAALARMILASPACFTGGKPRVLLVSPILVGANIRDVNFTPIREHGHEESLLFAAHYLRMADKLGVDFLDAAAYASPSELDAEHMTAEGHAALGAAIAEKITQILG